LRVLVLVARVVPSRHDYVARAFPVLAPTDPLGKTPAIRTTPVAPRTANSTTPDWQPPATLGPFVPCRTLGSGPASRVGDRCRDPVSGTLSGRRGSVRRKDLRDSVRGSGLAIPALSDRSRRAWDCCQAIPSRSVRRGRSESRSHSAAPSFDSGLPDGRRWNRCRRPVPHRNGRPRPVTRAGAGRALGGCRRGDREWRPSSVSARLVHSAGRPIAGIHALRDQRGHVGTEGTDCTLGVWPVVRWAAGRDRERIRSSASRTGRHMTPIG
jgi:hypothetical protein